jgi:Uma2 family endonuclease
MNIQPRYPKTADEFLLWNENREGKREFVNGRIVEMTVNVTRNHVMIASNLLVALRGRLERGLYDVGSADFGVRSPDGVRYPDVYVDLRSSSSAGTDLAATAPVFVAEVLSPSSVGRDFVELKDYRGIEGLRHYAIFSHEDVRAWLWSRAADGNMFVGPSEIIADENLDLAGLEISVPMSEIYLGIEFVRR